MMDKKGIPTPTQLFVRVTQNSTSESAIASGAAEPTEISVQRASQFAIATLSDQQKLAMSFNTLMEKLKILVKIGDAVTKVCFSASSPLWHNLKHSQDSSLCQFCVAGVVRGIKGGSSSIILILSPDIFLRSDGARQTSSGHENFRSRQSDGIHLLVGGFGRWTEELP